MPMHTRAARDQLANLRTWGSLLAMFHPQSFDAALKQAEQDAAEEEAAEEAAMWAAYRAADAAGVRLFRD